MGVEVSWRIWPSSKPAHVTSCRRRRSSATLETHEMCAHQPGPRLHNATTVGSAEFPANQTQGYENWRSNFMHGFLGIQTASIYLGARVPCLFTFEKVRPSQHGRKIGVRFETFMLESALPIHSIISTSGRIRSLRSPEPYCQPPTFHWREQPDGAKRLAPPTNSKNNVRARQANVTRASITWQRSWRFRIIPNLRPRILGGSLYDWLSRFHSSTRRTVGSKF